MADQAPVDKNANRPDDAAPTHALGEKVEEAITSFADFILTFGRTAAFAAWPPRLVSKIATSDEPPAGLVKPLSFLCVAFLPYSVILAAASSSYWEVLLDPYGVSAKIISALSKASPLKILIAALPALIVLFVSVWLPSRLVSSSSVVRRRYLAVACYSFGAQCLCIEFAFVFLILGDRKIAPLLFPVSWGNPLKWPDFIFWVPYVAIVYGVLNPPIALGDLARRLSLGQPPWRRVISTTAASSLAVVLILGINWLGILPGRLQEHLRPAPTASLTLIDDLVIKPGPRSAALTVQGVIENPTNAPITIGRESLALNARRSDNEPVFPANEFKLRITDWQDGAGR